MPRIFDSHMVLRLICTMPTRIHNDKKYCIFREFFTSKIYGLSNSENDQSPVDPNKGKLGSIQLKKRNDTNVKSALIEWFCHVGITRV